VVITDWKHDYNHRLRHSASATDPLTATLPIARAINDFRSPWSSGPWRSNGA
jgi:hypothetical protein